MNPIRFLALVVPVLLALGVAPAATLPEALARAEERTGVVTARMTASDAERALARTEADPLALRPDLVEARQAAELAEAELRVARFEAYLEIAEAYVQVLQLERQTALAEDGVELSRRALEIAQLRFERGGATELDVRDARNELADAESGLASARQGLALARSSFTSLTGLSSEDLEPVPDALLATPTPDLDELRERMDRAPALLQAVQGLELARVGRALLDPSYAARTQIETAELRVEQAQEAVAEARRGLELQLRSLVDAVASAREAVDVARDALANARERESIDRSRLEAGLIAEIAFQQTQLATRQAELTAVTAEHDLLLALLRLQAQSGVPVEGLDDF